ncbi:hypothetical protein BIW11_01860 [Tropilaelaps mercedesae]|uniref:Uncharacterized protein n=1 Tax=Tropilaelaps mercedesae TaxID=418985 RepID=A0A1V9X7J0_9ACAR|nr:hypothetical protein BIW11_01860 [Tropilaelaps mercedesae]
MLNCRFSSSDLAQCLPRPASVVFTRVYDPLWPRTARARKNWRRCRSRDCAPVRQHVDVTRPCVIIIFTGHSVLVVTRRFGKPPLGPGKSVPVGYCIDPISDLDSGRCEGVREQWQGLLEVPMVEAPEERDLFGAPIKRFLSPAKAMPCQS